jgi:hypothetical protein
MRRCLTLDAVAVDAVAEPPDGTAPFPHGRWRVMTASGVAVQCSFGAGVLAPYRWLTADMLLDGLDLAVFRLELQEGSGGPTFVLRFGLLNQVQARIRFPLEYVDQRAWQIGRDGAWLKPMCTGAIVDLAKVDRLRLRVEAAGREAVRFSLGPLRATVAAPRRLTRPVLPRGPITDAMGQSLIRDWPTKTRSTEELIERLHGQRRAAPAWRWPDAFSAWGGWRERAYAPTGFFRTHHDGGRWWLVDPDGHAFWSMGVDCVRSWIESYASDLRGAYAWLPPARGRWRGIHSERDYCGRRTRFADFLEANMVRAFGGAPQDAWAEVATAEMRRIGFNTVGNWSEWPVARAARLPYVRPLDLRAIERLPKVFRDFPDVFDPAFERACVEYARQLGETRDDAAFVGYFLMNEPTWGFAAMTPAKGMLYHCSGGPCRRAFADWLRARYGRDAAFANAWGAGATFARAESGLWTGPVGNGPVEQDLAEFSGIMVERLFAGLSRACKAADPNHLNLGARYYTVPPWWAVAGMRSFDVFSINAYSDRFPADKIASLHETVKIPVLVGEWHFGALDAGLPGSALRQVPDQKARGEAYRVYAEAALAHPACVGAHYFTLYDESPMGRFDGENWNIGFLDVCHRPYEPLCAAARATHERMYRVAAGLVAPYDAPVEYQPPNTL